MNIQDYDWDRLDSLGFTEESKEGLKSACWKGYEAVGMKTKNGKKVPNCVPVKKKKSEYNEDPRSQMTPEYLPDEPGEGDDKNPMMAEVGIRMPRMEEIRKANSKDRQLAMASAPNYSEEMFQSMEPNAAMAINQLRVMREKIDNLLGMLYPDDNIEPWCASKLTVAGQNLASVSDYLQYGAET